MKPSIQVVVLSHPEVEEIDPTGWIHHDIFRAKNPDIPVWIINNEIEVPEGYKAGKKLWNWRNSDAKLARAAKNILHENEAETFLIVEYDTVIDIDLSNVKIHIPFGVNKSFIQNHRYWKWWGDADKFPEGFEEHVWGIHPFGAMFLNRACMETIAYYWENTDIFTRDIFCELRLPTLLSYALDVQPSEMQLLKFARPYPFPYKPDCIFHPMKQKININS